MFVSWRSSVVLVFCLFVRLFVLLLLSFFFWFVFHASKEVFPTRTRVVYHLQKYCGKSGWKVNGTWLFWSFQLKISGSNGTSENLVLFFRTEYSKQKFVFHYFKAIVDTSFRPSRSFFGKWNWFVQMVNEIPRLHLPVLNFAYDLPKPWTDRFAPVNGKQPGSSLRIPIWSGTQEDLFINLLVLCSGVARRVVILL